MNSTAKAVIELGAAVAHLAQALHDDLQAIHRRLDQLEGRQVVYSVREAAKALGVSERTVQRMVADGDLPALPRNDGRRVTRIPAWALEGRAA